MPAQNQKPRIPCKSPQEKQGSTYLGHLPLFPRCMNRRLVRRQSNQGSKQQTQYCSKYVFCGMKPHVKYCFSFLKYKQICIHFKNLINNVFFSFPVKYHMNLNVTHIIRVMINTTENIIHTQISNAHTNVEKHTKRNRSHIQLSHPSDRLTQIIPGIFIRTA